MLEEEVGVFIAVEFSAFWGANGIPICEGVGWECENGDGAAKIAENFATFVVL